MTTTSEDKLTEPSSNSATHSSEKDISGDTQSQLQIVSKASENTEKTLETKTKLPENDSATEKRRSIYNTPSLGREIINSSHPSVEQDPQVQVQSNPATDDASAPTSSQSSADKHLPSGTSFARVKSTEHASAVCVSPSDGSASTTAISPGITSRLSSLSATAGASLRGLIVNSSVINDKLGSVTHEGGSSGSQTRQTGTGPTPTSGAAAGANPTEPATQTGSAEGTQLSSSADVAVKFEEPIVKHEQPDCAEATPSAAAEQVPDASLKTHDSEAFTPSTAPFSPETERPEHQPSESTASASGRSAPSSSRGVKLVKAETSSSDRRSSSYLYNDWDRTLYEKTGRPPPGEAHWSREKSAQPDPSSTRFSGPSACSHSRTSAQPAARSPSTRRQRSRSRPASSPTRRLPFDMSQCRRQVYDQFGRRIVYHHCFIEPEFTLHGRQIPVQGARKGSITAAEDTYVGYMLESVTPPSERQLYAQKVHRRKRDRKKRRRRRRRQSPRRKSVKGERALVEEQWQRLEDESEQLEEDKMRLQETRQHLEQLEVWWETEGILILQRDELRAEEEKIINAVIEEECLRITEERTRIRQEWQFLLERMARQDKEEVRVKEDMNALDEMQDMVTQREETERRRVREMNALLQSERRMMEEDRRKLVNDALTCDTFRDALEDAELVGWAPLKTCLAEDTRSGSCVRLLSSGEPTQSEMDDLFADLKDSSLERLLADASRPPAEPGSEQRPPAPAIPEPDQRAAVSVTDSDRDSARSRPVRPITARGRPLGASRSTPSGDAMAHQITSRPLSAARSEGAGLMAATSADTPGAGGGEMVDVWRRRATVAQRSDTPSAARPASARVPSVVFARPDEPARGRTLRAAPAGDRAHAKSEGCINSIAQGAAVESERRRASATPRLETQDIPAQSTPARASPPAQSATLASTPASSEPPQPRDHSSSSATVSEQSATDGAGSSTSRVEQQPSSRPSSVRSGDVTQRHVSFHEKAKVQTLNDGADSSSAGELGGEDGGDAGGLGSDDDYDASPRGTSTAPGKGGSELKEDN